MLDQVREMLDALLDRAGLYAAQPLWLLALLLVIPLALWARKSLAGLGVYRKWFAISCRTLVLGLIILALAEIQAVQKHDSLVTIFLVDVSESIPVNYRGPVNEFIKQSVKSKFKRPDDRAGVIVFGKNPAITTPPTRGEITIDEQDAPPDPQNTDIASAIKLALASFPEESAKRLVIFSDGNQNRGNSYEQAGAAAGLKAQIDVVPIEYRYDREVLVEKVSIPPDVKQGETVNINVVIRASAPVKGKLQILQQSNDGAPQPILDEAGVVKELERGINVFSVKQTIKEPSFLQYTATFLPDDDSGDRRAINNLATGFTQARGVARVLLIEGTRGEHQQLVTALREKGVEVDARVAGRIDGANVVDADPLPTELSQLQPYDAVILANVAKDSFTEDQHLLFEKNTHDMGAGLIMLGGPDSFGAGRWMNTPVEKALPVDMQLRSEKFTGKAALVMLMHASEMAQGNFWQAKVAQESLKTLSSYDYCGMLHWQGQEAWLFPLMTIGANRSRMLRAIEVMTPGDMPQFGGAMSMALRALQSKTDAMTKHMIVISDGDPAPPPPNLLRQFTSGSPKITVTTVLITSHTNDPSVKRTMQDIANATGGRFYQVTNNKALPRIYQKEVRLISRPLIFEDNAGFPVVGGTPSEPMVGIDRVPSINGLVLTELKQSAAGFVETPLWSSKPPGRNQGGGPGQEWPLLAHWNYGLGRSVAFTSDAGKRWTNGWKTWESYSAFWSQLIRWSLRPVDSGNVRISLRREQGQVKIVADALDKNDEFLNFLKLDGVVVRPDMTSAPVIMRQTAPGRYEASISDAESRGNYFVNLGYRNQDASIRGVVSAGISVPYSDEYRELESNRALLENLASLTNGNVIDWETNTNGQINLEDTVKKADVFRRDPNAVPPRTFQDLWPQFLFWAAVLFLGDVGIRRLAPDTDRIKTYLSNTLKKWRGQEPVPVSEYMEKLKGRKAEVSDQIEKVKAGARFLPPTPANTSTSTSTSTRSPGDALNLDDPNNILNAPPSGPARRPDSARPTLAPDAKGPDKPESYTDRLLKAKQRVWDERDKKDKPKDDPQTPGKPS